MVKIQQLNMVSKNELKAAEISENDAIKMFRIYKDEEEVLKACKILGYTYHPKKTNKAGFRETSLNNKTCVASLNDAIRKVKTGYGTNNGKKTYRTCYPCYVDTEDSTTLRFIVIIRPPENEQEEQNIKKCDSQTKSMTLTEAMTL